MGIMVCGAETTKEDEIIYDPDVREEIVAAVEKLKGYEGMKDYEVLAVLETLVWKTVRRYL